MRTSIIVFTDRLRFPSSKLHPLIPLILSSPSSLLLSTLSLIVPRPLPLQPARAAPAGTGRVAPSGAWSTHRWPSRRAASRASPAASSTCTQRHSPTSGTGSRWRVVRSTGACSARRRKAACYRTATSPSTSCTPVTSRTTLVGEVGAMSSPVYFCNNSAVGCICKLQTSAPL